VTPTFVYPLKGNIDSFLAEDAKPPAVSLCKVGKAYYSRAYCEQLRREIGKGCAEWEKAAATG